ncbi:MAG: hypothetical protein PHW33_01625 [Candidatus Portnoybacteria bacterium]|jgi:hypothetical protein|nr:hypothetical protein [Candidatus Portnoybacteria bacterium]
MKKQIKKQDKFVTHSEMDRLLSKQTGVILDAMDRKFQQVDFRFQQVNKRMDRLENSLNELKNTLDKFLKRLMDFDDEFKIVKARLARVEKILHDKLGVAIDRI